MSNDEVVVSASDGASASAEDATATILEQLEQVKDECIKQFNESAAQQPSLELAEAPNDERWEIWALGPFQQPSQRPSRIIALGENATIVTVVFMNNLMFNNLSRHGSRIKLSYHTSNTETMTPVPAMDDHCCFIPRDRRPDVVLPFGVLYFIPRIIDPTEAACLMETNICAHVCSCDGRVVPDYAAFVRWVAASQFDRDLFFPPVTLHYDHPIRYLVYDNDNTANCNCDNNC